jgi:hypothetical protein
MQLHTGDGATSGGGGAKSAGGGGAKSAGGGGARVSGVSVVVCAVFGTEVVGA